MVLFLYVTASSSAGMGTLKKANMLFLTKEATKKDQKLKMEMLMSTTDDKKNSETIWKKNGFFSDQKGKFTISKNNFPENTLACCNQGTISTVKSGENTIYLDYVVLGKIIPVRNCPPDIENYECDRNEVTFIMPDYDTTNSHFNGVKKWLGYIMVRGDEDELFLSYRYNEEKSMVLFSSCKQALPHLFQGISFKKHNQMLFCDNDDFSKLFFYLPSTTDRNEKINKFRENVQLHPTDCLYVDFVKYSSKQ